MKRWITLFVSFAVLVSALSLGAFADESEGPMFVRLYIGSSFDNLTQVSTSYLEDRVLGYPGRYNYGKITALRINVPANYYFFFSFDISSTDLYLQNNSVLNTVLDSSSSVSGLGNIVYDTTKYNIFWSTVKPIRYTNGAMGVHIECYGVNYADEQRQVIIEYTEPILFHTESYTSNSGTFYLNNQFVNCQVHYQPDINSLVELLDQYYSYWEDTYLPTINTFYTEFHQYWETLVNTYMRLLYQSIYASSFSSYDGIQTNQDGTISLILGSHRPMIAINNNLSTIAQLLGHQLEWENQAAEAGADDAYSDLNDSADFGSLSDFAGAGSAASWSTGSFSDGLSGIWDFFSNDTFYDLDTTDNRHDSETYIEYYYSDNLSEYFNIVGSEYDGSASNPGN